MKLVEGGWPGGTTLEATLPGGYYTSPPMFQRELERIWFTTWLCAGRVDQIPHTGDFLAHQVGDESIIVVRGRQGGINAFYNVCRHRGARLCTEEAGTFKGGLIRCPYHSWTYDTSQGALVAAPNVPEDRELFDKARFPLVSLRVQTWEGYIWVNFNPQAPALEAALGLPASNAYYERYHVGDLTVGKVISYEVNANWKIVMENGLECYHCLHIHPELSRCTPPLLPRHWLHDDLPETKVFKHSGGMELAPGFETATLDGRPRRPRFPDLAAPDRRTIYYAFIYPQMLLAFAPDYVFFFAVWPLAVDKTKVWAYWLFEPSVVAGANFDPSDAVDFWDITNRQDWQACALVHQGNQSRAYRSGGVLIQNEWRVTKFKRYVLEELEERDGEPPRKPAG